MAETAAAGDEYSTTAAHSWIGELLLRLLGAALQILATWAVIRALTPEEAGVYFRGFVIALGLSTLLRGKYEIIWRSTSSGGVPRPPVFPMACY